MTIKWGSTRTVILTNRFAFKIPYIGLWRHFLLGLLANMQERQWHGMSAKLCPVTSAIPGGFLLVMPRASELSREAFDQFDFEGFVEHDDFVLPVENKLDSFGKLNGQIVAIDYGS